MATTLVSWASKGRATKRTLYVGGLDDKVDQNLLHAAFIPFGDIKDVSIPLDFKTGKHRGFGFVEFEEKEDAAEALDNMHNAEINGRVLSVNFAQPNRKGQLNSKQPVWADQDAYQAKLDESQVSQETTHSLGVSLSTSAYAYAYARFSTS